MFLLLFCFLWRLVSGGLFIRPSAHVGLFGGLLLGGPWPRMSQTGREESLVFGFACSF